MKIMWVGTSPAAATGYGRISREIIMRLIEKYEVLSVSHLGDVIVRGGVQEATLPNGKKVLSLPYENPLVDPSGAARMLSIYAKKYEADLAIGFWDAFALGWMKQAKIPFMQMVPIDGNVTSKWLDYFEDSMKVIAYSKYGYDQLKGLMAPSLLSYIPHGIDCEVFRPLGKDKAELRSKVACATPIPEDCFLMSTNQANYTDRKKLPLLLRTFSKFARKHKDVHLYLHGNAKAWTGQGYDLEKQAANLGVGDEIAGRVHFSKYDPAIVPLSDEELNVAYNASDLYITNSCAEGFGVPLLESMAAGTPVLCPRNSSQTELVEGHGYIAENIDEEAYVDYPMYVPYGNYYPVCDQRSLLGQMEWAYDDRELLATNAKLSREFALTYSWEKVMKLWFSLLDRAEDEIKMWKSTLA